MAGEEQKGLEIKITGIEALANLCLHLQRRSSFQAHAITHKQGIKKMLMSYPRRSMRTELINRLLDAVPFPLNEI